MIVEVFGVCGIGKSTILKDFVSLLKYNNLKLEIATDKEPSIFRVRLSIIVILIHLLKTLTLKQFFEAYSAGNFFYFIKKLSYRHAKRSLNNTGDVLFFNESGLIQSLITHVMEDQLYDISINLEKILEVIQTPDILIIFEGDILNAKERYQHREKLDQNRPVRRNFNHLLLLNRFHAGKKACVRVKKFYMDKNIKIITVNSDVFFNKSVHEKKIEINNVISEINET